MPARFDELVRGTLNSFLTAMATALRLAFGCIEFNTNQFGLATEFVEKLLEKDATCAVKTGNISIEGFDGSEY